MGGSAPSDDKDEGGSGTSYISPRHDGNSSAAQQRRGSLLATMARAGFAVALITCVLLLFSSLLLVELDVVDIHRPWRTLRNGTRALAGKNASSLLNVSTSTSTGANFLLGVGKADITGPVVEINFMGYADPAQTGTGLRQRLYSRAFIVASPTTPEDRWVYLVLDTQSGDTAVRHGILEELSALGPDYAVYGNQNVAVTGTHSHSGPGAWLNYLLPQITSKGFDKESYEAIVDGAVESIKRAHESLKPGHLSIGTVDVVDANTNRSPYAYLANPADERARYEYDVDKTMTVLRFTTSDNDGSETDAGILTWFPVHGTSMLGNNTLATGDNKGVAAYLFEQTMRDSNGDFVAGFSQANVGDTSPNVLGAYCEYGEAAGEMCDFKTSLCGNISQPCHGRGPYWGRNDAGTASAFEIGRRQFEAAQALFENSSAFKTVSTDAVKASHHFIDVSTYHFRLPNGTDVRTCPAALGYSFAAGTTDGPGAFDFKQAKPGDPDANPLWAVVSNLLTAPNDTQKACQAPKPILLDVGETRKPYAWTPNIVDIQTLRVGELFVIVVPGEVTTMSGRRWKEAVQSSASSMVDATGSDQEPIVVLGGPANTYAHYIATPEEYQVQRYEGASTLYGAHTLDAYINLTLSFLPDLDSSSPSKPRAVLGPSPPINSNRSLSFITGVVFDGTPFFKSFGKVTQDVKSTYRAGDTISAKFVGANPRNNLRLEGTYAAVEQHNDTSGAWEMIREDADWSLVYQWRRTSSTLGTSEVTISWETAWETGAWQQQQQQSQTSVNAAVHGDLALSRRAGLAGGRYRLRYYGDSKSLGGTITAFQGVSGDFTIV